MRRGKYYVISLCIFNLLSLSSCRFNNYSNLDVNLKASYDQIFFGNSINLKVENHDRRSVCLIKSSIFSDSPGFHIFQDGKPIAPESGDNREVVTINGVDVAEGLDVIPSMKSRSFFINLDRIPLRHGKFSASIELEIFDCADIFLNSKPLGRHLRSSVSGVIS